MANHWSNVIPQLDSDTLEIVSECDNGGCYEFDIVSLVRDRNGYHIVSSSGCSCPSYEDCATYESGPFLVEQDAKDSIPESHRHYMKPWAGDC